MKTSLLYLWAIVDHSVQLLWKTNFDALSSGRKISGTFTHENFIVRLKNAEKNRDVYKILLHLLRILPVN
jgi:hypothetical protein